MYLDRFNSSRAALMEQASQSPIDGYTLGVHATFGLSYKQLLPPDRDFLRLISNFHHSDIPTVMLPYAADEGFRDPEIFLPRPGGHEKSVSRLVALLGTNASEAKVRMEETIRSLRSFSLVSTTFVADSLFLQIHPLVQAWARDTNLPDAKTSELWPYRSSLPAVMEGLLVYIASCFLVLMRSLRRTKAQAYI